MLRTIIFVLVVTVISHSNGSVEDEMDHRLNHSNRLRVLSRKRRYLTFPSGSSLQLVYCLTMPSVGVGAIFTFGLTAALAWELPSDADELLLSLGKKKIATTTETPTTTLPPHHDEEDHHHYLPNNPFQRIGSSHFSDEWTNENNKYPAPVKSYYDPFRLKENFKYVSDMYPSVPKNQFNTMKMNSTYDIGSRGSLVQNNYINSNELDYSYIHPVFHQVHRRTRRELYGKLEKLLTALSKDGKACLKKAICQVSQIPRGKGTMFEEIMKTIFRIKPHDDYPDEDEYDIAFNKNHNCTEIYPTCRHSVWVPYKVKRDPIIKTSPSVMKLCLMNCDK